MVKIRKYQERGGYYLDRQEAHQEGRGNTGKHGEKNH